MNYGIRVRRGDGSIALDIGSRMTIMLGDIVTTAGVDGSFSIPVTAGLSEYFAFMTGVNGGGDPTSKYFAQTLPLVRVEGNVVKWTYQGAAAGLPPSVTILYGGVTQA